MNTYLIDGNNLIHKISEIKKLFQRNPDAAQHSLLESSKMIIPKTYKLILYFDGHGTSKCREIKYSGTNTADELIRKYIEHNYKKETITVVSSDYGITEFAKVCACKVIKSENFLRKQKKSFSSSSLSGQKPEKPQRVSKKDLELFKILFK